MSVGLNLSLISLSATIFFYSVLFHSTNEFYFVPFLFCSSDSFTRLLCCEKNETVWNVLKSDDNSFITIVAATVTLFTYSHFITLNCAIFFLFIWTDRYALFLSLSHMYDRCDFLCVVKCKLLVQPYMH